MGEKWMMEAVNLFWSSVKETAKSSRSFMWCKRVWLCMSIYLLLCAAFLLFAQYFIENIDFEALSKLNSFFNQYSLSENSNFRDGWKSQISPNNFSKKNWKLLQSHLLPIEESSKLKMKVLFVIALLHTLTALETSSKRSLLSQKWFREMAERK